MTREEAKRRLLNIERSIPNTFRTKEDVRNFEALEMAIKALTAIDTMQKIIDGDLDTIIAVLKGESE